MLSATAGLECPAAIEARSVEGSGRPNAMRQAVPSKGARAHASEVLSLSQELEDPRGIAWSLDVAAGLLAAVGESEGAARLWGASDRLLESVGSQLSPEIRWSRARYIDPVRSRLGTSAFESARAQGRTTARADAIDLARQQARLQS